MMKTHELYFVMRVQESRICIFIILKEKPFCVLLFLLLFIGFFNLVLLIKIKLLRLQTSNKFWIVYFNLNFANQLKSQFYPKCQLRPSCTHTTNFVLIQQYILVQRDDVGIMTKRFHGSLYYCAHCRISSPLYTTFCLGGVGVGICLSLKYTKWSLILLAGVKAQW